MTPCHRRLQEVSSGCVPARGVRVERRAAGTTGCKSFVSIHTRSTVTRDPPPELYRDVRDAYKTLSLDCDTGVTRVVKGLTYSSLPASGAPLYVGAADGVGSRGWGTGGKGRGGVIQCALDTLSVYGTYDNHNSRVYLGASRERD